MTFLTTQDRSQRSMWMSHEITQLIPYPPPPNQPTTASGAQTLYFAHAHMPAQDYPQVYLFQFEATLPPPITTNNECTANEMLMWSLSWSGRAIPCRKEAGRSTHLLQTGRIKISFVWNKRERDDDDASDLLRKLTTCPLSHPLPQTHFINSLWAYSRPTSKDFCIQFSPPRSTEWCV